MRRLPALIDWIDANATGKGDGGLYFAGREKIKRSGLFDDIIAAAANFYFCTWRESSAPKLLAFRIPPGASMRKHADRHFGRAVVVYLSEGAPLFVTDSGLYYRIDPAPGLMVTLPHSMEHWVGAQQGSASRYSLSIFFTPESAEWRNTYSVAHKVHWNRY